LSLDSEAPFAIRIAATDVGVESEEIAVIAALLDSLTAGLGFSLAGATAGSALSDEAATADTVFDPPGGGEAFSLRGTATTGAEGAETGIILTGFVVGVAALALESSTGLGGFAVLFIR
jgi:hypothetical protein